MNGLHDVGGMHGFGSIQIEHDEPVFHEPWEGRVFAMALAMGKHFGITLDRSRFLMESVPAYDRVATSAGRIGFFRSRKCARLCPPGNLRRVARVRPRNLAASKRQP